MPFLKRFYDTSLNLSDNYWFHEKAFISRKKNSGKVVVSSIVMLHTFTCCCIYTFVIKNEAGPIVARIFNLFQNGTGEIDLELFRTGLPEEMWYLDQKFTLGVFMLVIIMPLSLLRSVKHLGWTSMIAIISIIFFVATVISRQPDAAESCPIHYEGKFIKYLRQI